MELTLPLACYTFHLRATTAIKFNAYSGSAWRGLFGHALKQASCVTHESDCKNCLLYRNCVYSYIFETPPPENTEYMRRYNAAPHPFILTPDYHLRALKPGETTRLKLTLIGKATQHLPYIVHALQQAGTRGIGPAEGKYRLETITQQTRPGDPVEAPIYNQGRLNPLPAVTPSIPSLPEHLTLEFQSPVRLKYQNYLLTPQRFQVAAIISNLLRRASMLSYFHDEAPLDLDFKSLTAAARETTAQSVELKWSEWTRYSSRQKTKLQMGGIIGSVRLSGKDIEPFWPLLWIGQWLHIGKATSMGLGSYRIRMADEPRAQVEAA